MDDITGAAIHQATDRPSQTVLLSRLIPTTPDWIEQLVLPSRPTLPINDRSIAKLAFPTKRDLDVVAGAGPCRSEHVSTGPAPHGRLQIALFQARPKCLDVSAILRKLARHPLPQLTNSRTIWPNDRPAVTPGAISK